MKIDPVKTEEEAQNAVIRHTSDGYTALYLDSYTDPRFPFCVYYSKNRAEIQALKLHDGPDGC